MGKRSIGMVMRWLGTHIYLDSRQIPHVGGTVALSCSAAATSSPSRGGLHNREHSIGISHATNLRAVGRAKARSLSRTRVPSANKSPRCGRLG